MISEYISGEFSRDLARRLFRDTHNGRTLSKMTADNLGTDTKTVHFWGAVIIIGTIFFLRKK